MNRRHGLILLVSVLLGLSCIAYAQDSTAPTAQYLHQKIATMKQTVENLEAKQPLKVLPLYLPGITSNIPTGFGVEQGTTVVGIGFHNDNNQGDAAVAATCGFGDPIKNIGANLTVSAFDTDNFGKRGGASLHLFHRLSNNVSVAAGYEDGIEWGKADSGHSVYVVGTNVVGLKPKADGSFSRLYLTLGAGNGRFQSEEEFAARDNGIHVFGGISTNITLTTNAFAEWNGKAANVGFSFPINNKTPLFITPAVTDVGNDTHRGRGVSLGITYAFFGH